MRVMVVVPHQKEWATAFEEEKESLLKTFGAEAAGIHHIGSTAIPQICAKPIIDIIVEVNDIYKVDAFNEALGQIGYEAKGENGIAGRRFFTKGGEQRTHHLHVFEKGNTEIRRHLAFRDYLTDHPDEAREYSKLKQKLALGYRFDPEGYTNGKSDFIKEIDRRASQYTRNQPKP